MSGVYFSIRACAVVWSLAAVALVACGSHELPRVVLAERCTPLDSSHPFVLTLEPRNPGLLRIAVEQKGISSTATLAGANAASPIATLTASTPIERFGVVTFAPVLRSDQSVTLTVRSRDSPEIAGTLCVSAEHVSSADAARLRAERAFAAAGVAQQAGDSRRAFDLYRAAGREFDTVDRQRAAQARHSMASIAYLNLRDDASAYVLATWALADLGPAADPALRSAVIALQAQTLLESQRLEPNVRRARVFELLRVAQALAQQSEQGVREEPRFDLLRGFAEYRAGNAPQAIALFTQAARQCEKLRDWECAAGARQNIATLAEEARDYTVALQSFGDALQALPPDLTPKLSADIWGNYGRLQAKAGLFRQSELSHRNSIRLYTRLGDCDGARMGTARLGTLLVQVGSIGDGDIYLRRAAALECPALLASAKRDSAIESSRDDIAPGDATSTAACVGLPAAESLTETGKVAVFNALLGLRDAARLANNEAHAKACLSAAQAYATTARTRFRLANADGAMFLERGDALRASAAFERGLAIADQAQLAPTHEHRSLAYIGLARSALLQNRNAAARRHAARALALGSARADLGQVVEALQLMAQSFSAEKADEPAISILRIAADLIEQVPIDDLDAEQRATWLATQHTVFSELTTLYAARAGSNETKAWEALEVSERGRARSLRYATNQATDVRATSAGEAASARYHELMRRITALAPPIQPGGTQEVSLDALAGLAHEGKATADFSWPATLRAQLAALDATVVEYAAGQDSLYAFVIDSEHISVVRLASPRDVAAAAATLYDLLREPESAASDVKAAARQVAQLTLWPLTGVMSHGRVIFVPDDALHTVPFAVLPWSAAADSALTVQRVELSVMPTTLFVTRAHADRTTHQKVPRLALFGDPVFRITDWERDCLGKRTQVSLAAVERERASTRGAGSLPRLPGSLAEIAAIQALAYSANAKSDVQSWVGCRATAKALRAAAEAGPELLHIATHGYVDAYRPRLSALALTPDVDSTGVVSRFGLLDILNTHIGSRLVVLSACDTSRGRLLPGEGVLGPAQAFLQAGAASVVASYWRIADRDTAQFMQRFYRYLLIDRLSAGTALRRAQLDAAATGASYEWAAFALYGWPDTSL